MRKEKNVVTGVKSINQLGNSVGLHFVRFRMIVGLPPGDPTPSQNSVYATGETTNNNATAVQTSSRPSKYIIYSSTAIVSTGIQMLSHRVQNASQIT